MCRISVVVPVYNAQEHLAGCVRSILSDAPGDLELILVDDGSTDDSPVLCNQLADEDSRVHIIHQKNGGASAARNAGIDAASGDYLLFVDSDDQLLPGLWLQALPVLQTDQPDLYVFGVEFSAGGSNIPSPEGCWPNPASLPDPARTLREQMLQGCTLAGPVAKFYRLSALHGLRFDPALKINEDILFNARFLAQCGPLVFCAKAFYYCNNTQTGSLSRRLRDDLLDAEAATRPAFRDLLTSLNLSPAECEALLQERRLHSALAQFGLLAGQKGQLPFARRAALTRQIFAVPGARRALAAQYRADSNRLLAVPYRICIALHAAGLLALYCALKNRFL